MKCHALLHVSLKKQTEKLKIRMFSASDVTGTLTVRTFYADLTDHKLIKKIFFYFSKKIGFTFHTNCLHWRQFV